VVFDRPLHRDPESPRVPYMQQPCWRWRQASAVTRRAE
jgi:hypothetical protein